VASNGERPSTVTSDDGERLWWRIDGGCGLCKTFDKILGFRQWETT